MTERDFEQLLRAGFREMVDDAAPSALRANVMAIPELIAVRPQRRLATGWGFPPMNRFAPIALVATAVVVAILIGIGLLVRPPNIGPSPVPGPTHSATSEPSATSEASAPSVAAWTATGNMIEPRAAYTATLLSNGTVLVAGGFGQLGTGVAWASAELYDPSSGTWTATGNMLTTHSGHTATLLHDGRVLVVGGFNNTGELYDPSSGTWTATGNMVTTWGPAFTATLLTDGRVLVAGENSNAGVDPVSAELYDPASGAWTATGSMVTFRSGHTATLLPDGKVLVAGGGGFGGKTDLSSAEVYDPVNGTWTATGSMGVVRGSHAATLLPDGTVLVVGGVGHNGTGVEWASAELYDPAVGMWTATGTMGEVRYGHAATLLRDGRVLVAGGFNSDLSGFNAPLASAELYDPSSGSWSPTANLVEAQSGSTATLLLDGRVLLLSGGVGVNDEPLSTAELYDPGSGS
jgi:hypothetical protein